MKKFRQTLFAMFVLVPLSCGGSTVTEIDTQEDAATGGSTQDSGPGGAGGSTQDASTGGSAGTTTVDAGGGPIESDATPPPPMDGGPIPDGMVDAPTDAFDCDMARAKYQDAFDQAVACSPMLNTIQCTDGLKVLDLCGCAFAANVTTPQKAKKAQNMYQKLIVANGCELDCGTPCYTGTQWFCDPNTNACAPGYE